MRHNQQWTQQSMWWAASSSTTSLWQWSSYPPSPPAGQSPHCPVWPVIESYQETAWTLHEGFLSADGNHLRLPPGGGGPPVLPLLLPPVSQLRPRHPEKPIRLLRSPPCRDSVPRFQPGPSQPRHCGLCYKCQPGGSQHFIPASPASHSG